MPLESHTSPSQDLFLKAALEVHRPTAGTEHVAELLYALARLLRPRRVLEIGSGYTTVFLARALADNLHAFQCERDAIVNETTTGGRTRRDMLIHDYYERAYTPRLVTVDDLSSETTAACDVPDVCSRLGVSHLIEFVHLDFAVALRTTLRDFQPLDLVWLDCGSYRNYQIYLEEVWPRVNRDGGLIGVHSTETNLEAQLFIHQMKLRQVTCDFNNFELCSFCEPHKLRQNSVSIFRIISERRTRLYSVRS